MVLSKRLLLNLLMVSSKVLSSATTLPVAVTSEGLQFLAEGKTTD